MQPYLVYIHSILRYFILLFAIVVVVQSLVGMMGRKKFLKSNKMMALFLLIFCDLQLLFGLAVYYYKIIATSVLQSDNVMKDPYTRFYAVEHSVGMIVAIILVHIGYSVTKKNMDDDRKFKKLFWCSFVAFAIFLVMIPWEGRPGGVGRPNLPVMPAS